MTETSNTFLKTNVTQIADFSSRKGSYDKLK